MLKVYNMVNRNFSVLYSIYSHYKIPCGGVRAGATKGHCCPTWTHTLQARVTSASLDALFSGPAVLDPVPGGGVD